MAPPASAPLPPDLRARLQTIVDERGEAGALAALPDLSRNTLARALGQLPIRRGTVELIRKALDGVTVNEATS